MARNADYDWDEFDAEAYFRHNYATPRVDDLWLTSRLAGLYEGLPSGLRVLDAGTGPNLITLLAAIGRADVVTSWEYSAQNVAWLQRAIFEEGDLSDNWLKFWSILRETAPEVYSIDDPLAKLRATVDLHQGSILDLPELSWDAGSMFFVAESMTEDLAEFRQVCRLFARAVKPGGSVVATFMERSLGYKTNETAFPAVEVSIGEVAEAFADYVDSIEICRVPDGGNPVRAGYQGMLFMTARIRPGSEMGDSE